ncbi:MAG: CBS domain-containing protein [Bacteroidetes bacterium]|nr:CBS domain-containing protein [Bacteroidota bacterium]
MDTEPPSGDSPCNTERPLGCLHYPHPVYKGFSLSVFLVIDTPSLFIGVLFILVALILSLVFIRQFLGINIEFRQSKSSRISPSEPIENNINATNNLRIRKEMAAKIDKLGEVQVRQIMQARVSIVAVSKSTDYPHLLEIIRESGYSRIPVYENDLDSVTGILHVKDLIGLAAGQTEDNSWQKLIRTPVLYVPEAKKIDQVLGAFQTKRQHLAIVVDEYGGTAGLITMEDVMEEIFGEIQDEFDEEPDVIYQLMEDGSYIFEGKTLIHDFCNIMKIETSHFDELNSEADSIAGLILAQYGELPAKNIHLEINGFNFEIIAASSRRIEQIRVHKIA